MTRRRAAVAGAAAATAWAALQPLDKRIFGCDYSDVALLGKAVTRSRLWPLAGLAIHAGNGAVFGLAYRELQAADRATSRGGWRSPPRSPSMSRCTRCRPWSTAAIRRAASPGCPRPCSRTRGPSRRRRYRHALFGVVLGRLAAGR